MATLTNVINDLYFCYVSEDGRCHNCSRKNDNGDCDYFLLKDAIDYLKVLRNIQETAEPNDLNWVTNLIHKERNKR